MRANHCLRPVTDIKNRMWVHFWAHSKFRIYEASAIQKLTVLQGAGLALWVQETSEAATESPIMIALQIFPLVPTKHVIRIAISRNSRAILLKISSAGHNIRYCSYLLGCYRASKLDCQWGILLT